MNQVRVKTEELVTRVSANREEHAKLYAQAIKGYRQQAWDWFHEQALLAADETAEFQTYFPGERPEDHTNDYDVVLDMLAMSEDQEVTLSATDFRKYVRDEWQWKQAFLTNSAHYLGENAQMPRGG